MKGEKKQKIVFEQTSKILISYQKESKITHFSTSYYYLHCIL